MGPSHHGHPSQKLSPQRGGQSWGQFCAVSLYPLCVPVSTGPSVHSVVVSVGPVGLSQLALMRKRSQNASPHTAGQSAGHVAADSEPTQNPSPQTGEQSAGQLCQVSLQGRVNQAA